MIIEYRQLTKLSDQSNVFLHKYEGTYKPAINEIVNISGNPYIVHRVSIALSDEDDKEYLYVTVVKLDRDRYDD